MGKVFVEGDGENLVVKEDKDKLISFLDNKDYRAYFLSALTQQRLNGRFKRGEKLFNELKELKWEWNLPQEEQTKIYELLSKIKIWLMVYKEN